MIEPEPAKALFKTVEPLVLASASPRRRALLASLGLTFDVIPSGAEESARGQGDLPETLVGRWAEEKTLGVARLHPDRWVLGADTIVVLADAILGKPDDDDDAAAMLERLSGREHEVMSGVCLVNLARGTTEAVVVRTGVSFRGLSAGEIAAYVGTGEPLDKAGAYGIQGLGACLVQSVRGSYTNVVGLPLCETVAWLLKWGVIAPVEP